MYDGKEMKKWKNGTANTNFLDLRSWIYLSHRFSTLAPNMLLRISYGLREKDSLIDDGKKKHLERKYYPLISVRFSLRVSFFSYSVSRLLVNEVSASHLLKKYVRKFDARRACDLREISLCRRIVHSRCRPA